jgi:hypothetical protein
VVRDYNSKKQSVGRSKPKAGDKHEAASSAEAVSQPDAGQKRAGANGQAVAVPAERAALERP